MRQCLPALPLQTRIAGGRKFSIAHEKFTINKIIRDKKFCTVRCLLLPFKKLDHLCHKGFASIFQIHLEHYGVKCTLYTKEICSNYAQS